MAETFGAPDAPTPLIRRLHATRLPPAPERRAIRLAARVSLREVGEDLGVHQVTVSKWERGTVHPRPDHAIAYRRLLEALRQLVQD